MVWCVLIGRGLALCPFCLLQPKENKAREAKGRAIASNQLVEGVKTMSLTAATDQILSDMDKLSMSFGIK